MCVAREVETVLLIGLCTHLRSLWYEPWQRTVWAALGALIVTRTFTGTRIGLCSRPPVPIMVLTSWGAQPRTLRFW